VLVDSVIIQRFVEAQSELHTVISVIKLRGCKHSRQIRTFMIGDDRKVIIGEGRAPFHGVLLGKPQAREP
jgi:circadian clock protein KaiC